MYYNLQKAADTLGLTSGDVNRLREQGKLRAFKDGADWKFRKEDVDKYLANMIKERSGAQAAEAVEEAPKISSDDFDSMFDHGEDYLSAPGAPDAFIETAEEAKDAVVDVAEDLGLSLAGDDSTDVGLQAEPATDGLTLDKADDDLTLAPEGADDLTFAADDDLKLADEPAAVDDDLKLADEPVAAPIDDPLLATDSSPLTDESSALVDEPEAKAPVDGLSLESDSGLSLAQEEDEFDLIAPPTAGGSTPLTSEDSALVDSEPVDNASSVDLAADVPANGSSSDNYVNTSNSDSGLSLLDDLTGGSNVDLGGDFVLGGSGSGSGSGSSLNLSGSDSGLALLGDSDAGFELDAAVSEESKVASGQDDGVYGLASDGDAVGAVLNLDKDADEEGATEFAGNDDSVFDLVDDSVTSKSTSDESSAFVSDSSDTSASAESNPFFTDDSEDSASGSTGVDDSLFTLDEPSAASPADEDGSITLDVADTGESVSSDSAANPFQIDDNSFASGDLSGFGAGAAVAASGVASAFGASASNSFGGESDVFGASSGASFPTSGASSFGASFSSDETEVAPQGFAPAPAVSSMNFTGKDLLFLVPCLIFLILATIGAVELCRTIWSYQEGTGELAGPLLESIAKMFKMI